tara:strand:+ start:104 stop:454 length:351 start_codon:yes stop_codon:yes gene_type:complete
MNRRILIYFIPLFILINGCQTNSIIPEFIIDTVEETETEEETQENNELIITESCGNENLKEYLEKGWIIENSEEKEIVCTWKTMALNNKCDINLDKGCKITVPNTYGIEKKYYLSR